MDLPHHQACLQHLGLVQQLQTLGAARLWEERLRAPGDQAQVAQQLQAALEAHLVQTQVYQQAGAVKQLPLL